MACRQDQRIPRHSNTQIKQQDSATTVIYVIQHVNTPLYCPTAHTHGFPVSVRICILSDSRPSTLISYIKKLPQRPAINNNTINLFFSVYPLIIIIIISLVVVNININNSSSYVTYTYIFLYSI